MLNKNRKKVKNIIFNIANDLNVCYYMYICWLVFRYFLFYFYFIFLKYINQFFLI